LAEETVVAGFAPAKEWLKIKLPAKYKDAPENAKLTEMVREALGWRVKNTPVGPVVVRFM